MKRGGKRQVDTISVEGKAWRRRQLNRNGKAGSRGDAKGKREQAASGINVVKIQNELNGQLISQRRIMVSSAVL
jgi:hypothetical protein